MAYTSFVDNKPVATDTGAVFADTTRENLMAMRDAVVMGAMVGWAYSSSGGAEPATITYSKGTERLRASLDWGSSGGADGNVTEAVWEYSADSGSTYDAIGTEEITYTTDGLVSVVAWV